jgi:hypothetical protein
VACWRCSGRRRAAMPLTGSDGTHLELPGEIFEVLQAVVAALAQGLAITVAPHQTVLSSSEAAKPAGRVASHPGPAPGGQGDPVQPARPPPPRPARRPTGLPAARQRSAPSSARPARKRPPARPARLPRTGAAT